MIVKAFCVSAYYNEIRNFCKQMMTPQIFLAFAPHGAGLLCGLACKERGEEVTGWFTGMVGYEARSAYFLLEKFYTPQSAGFLATEGGDLYGGWRFDYRTPAVILDAPVPVPDDLCHELEHLQDTFAAEWLWYADGDTAQRERLAYEGFQLACQAVNLRSDKLNQLNCGAAVWTYASPRFDRTVLDYMARRWPLDYRSD